ncbi:hypothetical protein [Tenacibaculum agarivorans]|uniref:hypothetical protein n=1 Tax=Tenacibaculum agarivorans TaxID=1908389 RepID=UPI00094BA244|nr:hypothetical protein [Tenacibaculum agarivorans]
MEHYFKKQHREEGAAGVFIAKIILGIIMVIGLAILFGFIIMWLWNSLMPEIFGLPEVGYWQAVGLFILSKILFTSGGNGHKNHPKKPSKSKIKHKLRSFCDKNHIKEWDYYEQFWQEEGSEAFEKYIERINHEKNNETTEH